MIAAGKGVGTESRARAVSLRSACLLDPGDGPSSLAFTWRVLYEVIDISDDMRVSGTNCVLDGQIIARLADALGIPGTQRGLTIEQYVASVEPAARSVIREVLGELRRENLVQVIEDGRNGLLIAPTGPGYQLVTKWRRHWIAEAERLSARPHGLRRWPQMLTAPLSLAFVLGALAGALVTELLHLVLR